MALKGGPGPIPEWQRRPEMRSEDPPESQPTYKTTEAERSWDGPLTWEESLPTELIYGRSFGYENLYDQHGQAKSGFQVRLAGSALARRHHSELHENLRLAFECGLSIRAAAKFAECSKNTAKKWHRRWAISASCGCGKPSIHSGWCRYRLDRSKSRRAYWSTKGVNIPELPEPE